MESLGVALWSISAIAIGIIIERVVGVARRIWPPKN